MIYNFYIFSRVRKCLCREEWNRTKPCADVREEAKLVSGLLITLNSFAQQMGPPKTMGFMSYSTPQYKMHSFETATGYRFVLTTDPGVPDQHDCLKQIYADLFVEHVIKNPMYQIGEDVSKCTAFTTRLQSFLQTRPFFAMLIRRDALPSRVLASSLEQVLPSSSVGIGSVLSVAIPRAAEKIIA
eukprot:CAMPEP_0177515146 /NCGR_PEP_ID=MMETSP0369-20130122/44700_1 /TAXON_ID=447022 ORGANISM="Scrippsiella hangoei-like, Strain SHHI-4" /NCGR_SAMPLE_ID=MMETSP0369 /ASSEMBLY_ACC=CAM_ASM_000364 /LENGTH=184 /DNA_ID=CAMNT_0018993895 /DNA_START=86 /DNA_END=641 /DNA_ORIENTATION=-